MKTHIIIYLRQIVVSDTNTTNILHGLDMHAHLGTHPSNPLNLKLVFKP